MDAHTRTPLGVAMQEVWIQMKQPPLISIITPYRNGEDFLADLASNLQAQTYSHWECLLINHNSDDRGPSIANSLATRDRRFRALEESDPRPFPALPRNTGLAKAMGELICFLDVDDLWHPSKLEEQLAFHSHNNLDFSVTSYGRFQPNRGGAVIDESGTGLPSAWNTRHPPMTMSHGRLLWDNPIPMLTVMVNKEVLDGLTNAGGPFALIHHEDYLLWLILWRQRPLLRYGQLRKVLAFHRRHSNNITATRWKMIYWTYNVYRASGDHVLTAALRSARHSVIQGARASSSFFSNALNDGPFRKTAT